MIADASCLIGGVANAGVRTGLLGGSFGDNFVAAIPDIIGQAVGGVRNATREANAFARSNTPKPPQSASTDTVGEQISQIIVGESNLFDNIGGSDQGIPEPLAGPRSFAEADSLGFAENGSTLNGAVLSGLDAIIDAQNPLVLDTVVVTPRLSDRFFTQAAVNFAATRAAANIAADARRVGTSGLHPDAVTRNANHAAQRAPFLLDATFANNDRHTLAAARFATAPLEALNLAGTAVGVAIDLQTTGTTSPTVALEALPLARFIPGASRVIDRGVTIATDNASAWLGSARSSRLLDDVVAAGGKLSIKPGTLNARQLADAASAARSEVALVRTISGERQVVLLGAIGGRLPADTRRLIAHVQPGEGIFSVQPSSADFEALRALGQKSSLIINETGNLAQRFRPDRTGDIIIEIP